MSITDDIDALRERIGMRRPARIRIKRLPLSAGALYPWLLKDTARPHSFGHARTVEAALKLAELILAGERAVVYDDEGNTIAYRYEPPAEPREVPRNAPCTVEPIINMTPALEPTPDSLIGQMRARSCPCGGFGPGRHRWGCPNA